MAITSPVSLSKVHAEFGGTGPLSDYVRGGARVPNNAANAAISTTASGLKLSQFLGAENVTLPPTPTLTGISESDTYFGGAGTAWVDITLKANGKVRVTLGAAAYSADAYTWLPAGRSANEYQIRTSYDNVNWSAWSTITSDVTLVYISANTDGYYSDSQSQLTYVQLGASGTVLASGEFEGTANANGIY